MVSAPSSGVLNLSCIFLWKSGMAVLTAVKKDKKNMVFSEKIIIISVFKQTHLPEAWDK
jgi:hypothetical protein